MISTAIIGLGWVGKAMQKLFPDAVTYDTKSNTLDKTSVNKCKVAFVCVPTPPTEEGKLDTSIVEEVVKWCECPLIVIRSTVNPGTTDYLVEKYKKKIVVQPEYLGETPNHPMLDPQTRQFLIIGGLPEERRSLIEVYTQVYNANITIRQLSAYEAEVVKLTENRAIAFKVAQAQELYDVCQEASLDYYRIREAVYGDDPRFNLWWTFIYPQKRGFNSSKCLVKDVPAWVAWAESLGYNPVITKAIIRKSNWYAENKNN